MPQFGSYPSASALTGTETFIIKQGTATKTSTGVVARQFMHEAERLFVTDYGAIGDGDQAKATANTTAIQAAIDAAAALPPTKQSLASGGPTTGGGVVYIPHGVYYINNQLNVGNGVSVEAGGLGTRLGFANGTSTIASPKCVFFARNETNFISIRNITLFGNKENQEAGEGGCGIGVDRPNVGELYDGLFCFENVLAFGFGGWGFVAVNVGNTAHFINCYAYHNDDGGFALKTDQTITSCIAGNNGGDGFAISNGTSVSLVGCKSFGNGVLTTNRADFSVAYSNDITFVGCRSEDYGEMGFHITSSRHILLTGCHAYREDIAGVETGDPNRAAFWLTDDGAGNKCEYVRIVGCGAHGDPGSGRGIDNVFTLRNLGVGNELNVAAEGYTTLFNVISGTGAEAATVRVNNSDGTQQIAYAASVTIDPLLGGTVIIGALTGNITIANIFGNWLGQEMQIVFVQDAVGSRTVTWGSLYDVGDWTIAAAANSHTAIRLIADNAKWTAVR